jgi:hypothetical protein
VGTVTFYVYGLYRPDTLEPFYIGKGKKNRMRNHVTHQGELRANSHKARIIKRYAKLGTPIVASVIIGGFSDEKEAFFYESFFIKAIGRYPNGPLVNKTDGGEGWTGGRMTPEHKAALRVANTGLKRSLETRRLIADGVKAAGLHSPESYAQQAAKIAGRSQSIVQRLAASERVSGTIWITDGTITRRIKKHLKIPTGWTKGRPINWKGPDGRFM